MKKSAKKSNRTSIPATKLNREQRGKSKVLLIAVIAIILLVSVGAFFVSQKTGGSVVPGMKTSLNPNCIHNDPNLCKFLNNWATPRDYMMTSTSKMQGMTMESVYTIQGDNFQMSSKHNGKENSNMITISDTTYTLDYSDNKWWKQTAKPEDMSEMEDMITDFSDESGEDMIDKTKYTFIVKEDCANLTCFKYEVEMPGSESNKQFIWFDDRDYLLRRISMVDTSGVTSDTTYSYDTIKISTPSPLKEGDPHSGGSSAGYSEADVRKMMLQYQQNTPDSSTEMPVGDTSADGF